MLPPVSELSLDLGLTTGSPVDGLALSGMAEQGMAATVVPALAMVGAAATDRRSRGQEWVQGSS
jgi:hypothetical protein